MHPARAKAKTTLAMVETAASVAGLRDQMDRIEAAQAEILRRLDPPETQTPKPAPGRKEPHRG